MAYIKKNNRRQSHRHNHNRIERAKIYNNPRWVSVRDWKIINSPLCEECLKFDKVSVAEDIHHIVSFMSTDDEIRRTQLAYDYDNLMSLCKVCHQKKHNA